MLVYGRNVAEELLEKNEEIRKVYLQDNFREEKIKILLEKRKIPVIIRPKREMDRLSDGVHQGIILDIKDYQYKELNDVLKTAEFLVLLDHIEDPHNLGAIIRTSESAGVDAVIIPKDRQVGVNGAVMKTSAGALSNISVCSVTNLNSTIKTLKEAGFWIVGTSLEANSVDYKSIDYSGKIALVIGNEGKGMSRLVKESCDFIAHIPMRGKVNSLNASVAAGIMIYEVVRNRK